MTYQAFYYLGDSSNPANEDEWTEIQESEKFWLKFIASERKFWGYPSQAIFGQKLTIKVIATDGYSFCTDYFKLIIDKIPIMTIISYLVAIGGPIIGVFGVFRYK